jgi:hypothetical protein
LGSNLHSKCNIVVTVFLHVSQLWLILTLWGNRLLSFLGQLLPTRNIRSCRFL